MGQKDISLVRYFEDRGRYADLINGFVFQGKQVVSEDDVQEMDSRVTGVFGKWNLRFLVQKYRDCVRRVIFGMGFVIIGIENQDRVHHGMPARIMMEDAADYDKQMRQIRRYHRRKRDLREVIGFIQRAGDADEERKFTFENEDKFKAMDEEAFDVIVSVTGSDELEGMKDACREEGGKINMCEAIQGMIRQGREEGRQDKACKVAKNMYSRGFTAMETAGLIEENLETVREWYEEWDRQMQ